MTGGRNSLPEPAEPVLPNAAPVVPPLPENDPDPEPPDSDPENEWVWLPELPEVVAPALVLMLNVPPPPRR